MKGLAYLKWCFFDNLYHSLGAYIYSLFSIFIIYFTETHDGKKSQHRISSNHLEVNPKFSHSRRNYRKYPYPNIQRTPTNSKFSKNRVLLTVLESGDASKKPSNEESPATNQQGIDSALFMSPFRNITGSDMSEMLAEAGMAGIFTPKMEAMTSSTAHNEARYSEDSNKENVGYRRMIGGVCKFYYHDTLL